MAEFENEQKEAAPLDSDNPYVASFETGRRYRVHWSYILLGPIIAAFIALAFTIFNILGSAIAAAFDLVEFFIGPVVDVVVFIVLFIPFLLEWCSTAYAFDERVFSSYSGVFTKWVIHVPYSRIQSINYHASIIQRIFGVCTVTLDCIGGSATRPVSVPYVKIKVAERMRTELAMRKAAVEAGKEASITFNPDVKAAFDNDPIAYEYKQSAGELLKTALTNDKPAIVAYIVLLLAIIALGVAMFFQAEFAEDISDIAILIAIVAMIVVWVFGLFPILSSYGGYRVRRRGSRIEVERGVLTHDYISIDIDRVQSIEVQQSSIRRPFKLCELTFGRIKTSAAPLDLSKLFGPKKRKAKKAEDVKGLVVHPCADIDRASEIFENLAPELTDCPHSEECKHLPKGALGRALLRECIIGNKALWVAVVFAALRALIGTFVVPKADMSIEHLALFGEFIDGSLILVIVLAALLTIVRLIGAFRWARRSGYTWNSRYLLLRNDGHSTTVIAIPRHKIQAGFSRSTFFQRRKSLATLEAVTAAGKRGTVASLRDVPAEDVDAYLEWLKPCH